NDRQIERQIEFAQTRRSERDGVPTFQDRVDEPGAQESEVDEATDVTPADAVALGQLLERSGTSRGQLLKPRAPTHDRLDQRRITSLKAGKCSPSPTSPQAPRPTIKLILMK